MNHRQVTAAIAGVVALAIVLSGMLAAALGKARAKGVTKVDRQFAHISERLRSREMTSSGLLSPPTQASQNVERA